MATIRGLDRKNSSHHLRFEEFVPSSGWTQDQSSHCLIIDLPGFKRDQVKIQVDDYGHLLASGERQVNENKHVRFEQSYKIPENSNIEDTTAKFEDEVLYIIIPKKTTEEEEEEEEHREFAKTTEAVQEQNQQNASDLEDENLDGTNGRDEVESGSHHRNKGISDDEEEDNDDVDKEEEEEDDEVERGTHYRNEGLSEEEEEEYGDDVDEGKFQDAKVTYHGNESDDVDEEIFQDAKVTYHGNDDDLLGKLRLELMKNKGMFIIAVLAFSLGVLVSRQFQASEK